MSRHFENLLLVLVKYVIRQAPITDFKIMAENSI